MKGDEDLTALAEEGAGAAQSLATQLSAVRRSQMACWGIAAKNNSSGDNNSVGENGAAAGGAVTDEEEEEDMEVENNGTRGEQKAGEDGDTEAVAASEHGSCMGWWEGVLGRWHEKTQLVDPSLQKKFRVVNQGPWAQVTASLADRERANRRAFMTESEVRVCGVDPFMFFFERYEPLVYTGWFSCIYMSLWIRLGSFSYSRARVVSMELF